MNYNKNVDKNSPIELQISETFYLELFEKLKILFKIDRDTATYDVRGFKRVLFLFILSLSLSSFVVYDEVSRNFN